MSARDQFRRGFTLIEMLLVLVLIGVISGAVVTSLSGRAQEARITRAKADLSGNLSLALDLFEQDVGRYPTSEEGLEALVNDRGISNWNGPYLKNGELKPDPWGSPYIYKYEGEGRGRYRLSCSGPDGKNGTEDDIEQ